jgi:hypothetical protein
MKCMYEWARMVNSKGNGPTRLWAYPVVGGNIRELPAEPKKITRNIGRDNRKLVRDSISLTLENNSRAQLQLK